ncbi:RimJ/RimL family protein N-acetyltransferase [Streptosporangium sandarakinum]|uniref:RimJ/RimL family protein N-acetyltransferase n=1 Tax=Streptosporangium sandarakinum TaxID=1260955 RepID=A0A852UZC2_9ACTN|nr:GNAT family protein [Streptosporangium sandarakinum]NYF42842.1 RimJ/RimL family protein N-acetyltransferase [Streptosporangium sandarakinum]
MSRRVAEKAGFVVEATLRRRLLHRGMRVDVWVGSPLRDEAGRRTRTGSAADGPGAA